MFKFPNLSQRILFQLLCLNVAPSSVHIGHLVVMTLQQFVTCDNHLKTQWLTMRIIHQSHIPLIADLILESAEWFSAGLAQGPLCSSQLVALVKIRGPRVASCLVTSVGCQLGLSIHIYSPQGNQPGLLHKTVFGLQACKDRIYKPPYVQTSELAHCHFCNILFIKASSKANPHSKGRKIDSTS